MSSAFRRKRIALIVPSSNTVLENDLHAGLPKSHYTVHTDRIYLVETTREAELRMIEQFAPAAASDLGTAKPDLMVFGCTSAGSLLGQEGNRAMCAGLAERAGCPTLGVIDAVEASLTRAKALRLAVLTPYNEDLTQSVATAVSAGREIVGVFGLGITDNDALADPTPEDILAFAQRSLAGLRFDSLLISCANFRGLEAAPALEAAFGVPVVTSNRAVIEEIRARLG